jgi:hypothetical protein
VVKTVMQDQQFTEYQQVTTYRTQYVDQGQFADQQLVTQGRGGNRLQFLAGHCVTDPVTGTQRWQRGGLYWVPTPGVACVETRRVWVPNVVAQQVPVVQTVPQVVCKQVPIQVTEYVDEVQTQQIPYNVCHMQQEEVVQHIPYTVQRPVTQQMVQKYQVQVCNWQPQEMVRRVPITTCRMEYEERVEQIPVRTCKWVSETSTVMRKHCVAKWVPVTCTRLVPRTVMMVGGGDCCGISTVHHPGATAYYVPGTGQPAVSPSTSLKTAADAQKSDKPAASEKTESQDGEKSVLKTTPDLNGPDAPANESPDDELEIPQLPDEPAPSTEPAAPERKPLPQRPPYQGPLRLDDAA